MTPAEALAHYGIEWLSPSSCNCFAMSPAAWCAQYLLKRELGVGLPAIRGTAAEVGVAHGLKTGDSDAVCVGLALDAFDARVPRSFAADVDIERGAVPGIVRQALAELRQYGDGVETQVKVEYRYDDLPIPIIGYIDFLWPEHGILVDLKSQRRLASAIKPSHARQVALYTTWGAGTVGNADARVAYATPRECAVYGLESPHQHFETLMTIARTICGFVASSPDPLELTRKTVPDLDHFLWNGEQARELAWEVWGI